MNRVKGRDYWRYEAGDFRCNIPGPYRSPEFLAAYKAAIKGATAPKSMAIPDTVAWLIEQYLGSLRFKDLSLSRKSTIRGELDWLRGAAGQYQFGRLEVRHVEALMDKKDGPTAKNTVKKNLSMLFNFAAKKLNYTGPNPARFADKVKTNPDGYHTWTNEEIDRFLICHGPGSKARLALLLALNAGMSRQDLCGVGWQHVKDGRIAYKRGKTSVSADLPILPELADELALLPRDRLLFITLEGKNVGYRTSTVGNWFRDRSNEADVPGSLHGLRKAGATRLADAGASEWEIASYLAHKDTKLAAVYTKQTNRSKLADSGFAKLGNVSNLIPQLDKKGEKADE